MWVGFGPCCSFDYGLRVGGGLVMVATVGGINEGSAVSVMSDVV